MQLTETVKLYPNKYQTELIKATMSEYISTVNKLVFDVANGRTITKMTTADVKAESSKCPMQSMYSRCQVHHKKI